MKQEHQLIVDSMLSQASREMKKDRISSEQISLAEAIFKLLESKPFLSLLVANDEMGRSHFEVELAPYAKIDNKPKSKITETVILSVGRDETDPDNLTAEIKGRIWMADTFHGKSDKSYENDVYLIIRRSYSAEGYDTIEDLRHLGGHDWGANLLRLFEDPQSLAEAHGFALGQMMKELQRLAGYEAKKPGRRAAGRKQK